MRVISIVLLASMVMFSACQKDNIVGPAGVNGINGATGVTGATGYQGGVSNVIVKNYTISPTEFSTAGTSGQYQFRATIAKTVPEITQSVYDNGIIVAYWLGYWSGVSAAPRPWYPLPLTIYYSNYSVNVTNNFYVGGMSFQLYPSDWIHALPTNDVTVKVVIIPGTPKKDWEVDFNDYEAVKKYFKLKD